MPSWARGLSQAHCFFSPLCLKGRPGPPTGSLLPLFLHHKQARGVHLFLLNSNLRCPHTLQAPFPWQCRTVLKVPISKSSPPSHSLGPTRSPPDGLSSSLMVFPWGLVVPPQPPSTGIFLCPRALTCSSSCLFTVCAFPHTQPCKVPPSLLTPLCHFFLPTPPPTVHPHCPAAPARLARHGPRCRWRTGEHCPREGSSRHREGNPAGGMDTRRLRRPGMESDGEN